MRRQQRFLIVLVYNLLQAYASVFNFLQTYISKSSKSSSFNPLILSVRIALYCNFMRPANCKEMGIVTRCLPPAPQANRMSIVIHENPLLSTSFAVKGERKNAGCELFPRACTRRKKSRNLGWLQLFLFSRITHHP